MTTVKVERPGYRSLFWPVVLIAVGLIWLLGNLGIISAANIAVLFRVWPLLLIIIGLDLLFGRQSPRLGAMIGVGAVLLVIVLMFIGPSIGLGAANYEIKETHFEEPIEDANTLRLELDFGVANTSLSALSDSANLLEMDASYIGDLIYDVEGSSEKTITLRSEDPDNGFSFGLGFIGNIFSVVDDLQWDLRLQPDIPLNLQINGGVGRSVLDMRQLAISDFSLNGGVGEVTLMLPPGSATYSIDGGVGSLSIELAEGSGMRFDINGGVGAVTLDLPDNAAVRIEADGGLGGIHVPGGYETVGEEDWQSPSYAGATADERISIYYNGGIGGLTVR